MQVAKAGKVRNGSAAPERARPALSRSIRRRYLLFVLLVAPAFLLRLVTVAFPILQTMYFSLTNLDLLKNTKDFIGLQNFPTVATDPGVRTALSFTVILVVGATALELVVGMLVAVRCSTPAFGAGPSPVRSDPIPWAIPTIVAGYAFRWLLDDQFGLIPVWIDQLTGIRFVAFIAPVLARLTVVLAHVWKDAPFMAFVFLAGLQGVPQELHDAARVDGANPWHRFWSAYLSP